VLTYLSRDVYVLKSVKTADSALLHFFITIQHYLNLNISRIVGQNIANLFSQEYNTRSEALSAEKSEQENLVTKLTQAAKDKEVEYRIANKKTDNLVSILKIF